MEKKIKLIMSKVFKISLDSIKEDSSPDNIESWDSLNHMNLIVVLEEEFDFQFTDSEIIELVNFSLIKAVIKEKLT